MVHQLTTIPPIFSPFPPAIHPQHEAIDQRTADWAVTFDIGSPKLRSALVTHKIGTFAARILPEGNEEVVAIVADFVLWLFGVDDGWCEEGELSRRPGELLIALSRLLRVAQNPETPMMSDDPLALGIRDLRHRIDRYGTAAQVQRWIDALREYFVFVVCEAEHRSRERVPSLNDYALMRLYDGATSVVLPLLEMGYGYDLQPHERDRTEVRAACEMAHFIIGWDNDLFSHHKESRAGGYYLNVIRVLEQAYDISSSEAIDMAIAHRDRVMCLFLRLGDKLRAEGSPQLRQYLDSLEAFIRAAQDWELDSPRYTTPDDPADLPATFRDTPTNDSQEPLDIPAISWWWDLLPQDTTAGRTADSTPRATPPRTIPRISRRPSGTRRPTTARSPWTSRPSPGGEISSPRTPPRDAPPTRRSTRFPTPLSSARLRIAKMSTALQSIPRAPRGLPLLGHLWPMWRDPLKFVRSLRNTGDLVRVEVGTLPVVFVNNPMLAHEVMVTQSSRFEKGRMFDRVRSLFGNGLATADAKTHLPRRRLMQPAFHQQRIAGYCEIISDQAWKLAESFRPGQQLAVERRMMEFSIATLAATMFSSDLGRRATEVVRRDVPVILKYLMLRALVPKSLDNLPIPTNRKFDASAARLREVIDEVVVATRRDGDPDLPDLVTMLLAARDADTGATLSDTEVREELLTILFAGTETVGSTLAWTFYELARHPEVEERLLEEIDSVVGNGRVTFEDVAKLTYTRQVLDEVLRLHGVAMIMRRTVEDVELDGVTIPQGTEVAFSLVALTCDPRVYKDAECFDPDRWLPERRGEIPREAYHPFGAGTRKCIGDAFALAEATITLATVLARWRLRPVPGHVTKEVVAAMPYPDHIPMTVEARHR